MKKILVLIAVFTITSMQQNFAQAIKLGKVSKEELEEKYYPLDSSANAAILYKKRRTYYDYNGNEGWELVTKVHERIKIYNKEGYDWATKTIKLYTSGGDDETVSIKGYTFNFTGNKVEKIKLKNSEVFKENINKYWKSKKFTMPNLTEGCVIEWEYTIHSPYYSNIDDMQFQYEIPLKYIDSEIRIPEYFVFKYLPSTFYPIQVNQSQKNRKINFTYRSDNRDAAFSLGGSGGLTKSNNVSIDFLEKIYSSIEKNIPAIKDEPFTNNINNYKSKTSFELTAYTPKYGTHKYFNNTWEDVTKTIYKNSRFGAQLEKTSHFKEDLRNSVNTSAPLNEKIITIFNLVKSKIKWDGFYSKYTAKGVKKAYNEGTGNVAEINLTLVSMLRQAGVNANPILVSTRDHGIPLFPTSEGFNYVIAGVEVNNNVILLDATEKYSLPNVLPLRDLNWQGRIVRKDESSNSINLLPKKHTKETCFLNIEIDDEGDLKGIQRVVFDNLQALQHRKKYNNVIENDMIAILEKDNGAIEINQLKVTNKNEIGKSLVYQFDFETDSQVELIGDKMYFSPLLFLSENENPFKLDDRKFPVDFGTPWEDKYTVSIQLPEGYTIESKPENVAYALPQDLGSYKFITVAKGNKLQVLSTIRINFPIIAPNYYGALKEFYKKMVDKQLEKVVLTKI